MKSALAQSALLFMLVVTACGGDSNKNERDTVTTTKKTSRKPNKVTPTPTDDSALQTANETPSAPTVETKGDKGTATKKSKKKKADAPAAEEDAVEEESDGVVVLGLTGVCEDMESEAVEVACDDELVDAPSF